eukprot:9604-Heterococcus_DN1.PRE.18
MDVRSTSRMYNSAVRPTRQAGLYWRKKGMVQRVDLDQHCVPCESSFKCSGTGLHTSAPQAGADGMLNEKTGASY